LFGGKKLEEDELVVSIIERNCEGCDGGGRRRGTAMGGPLKIEQRIDIYGGQQKRRRVLATEDQTALTDTMKQSWIKPVLISVMNIYSITTL
jgi:hypothetical protein